MRNLQDENISPNEPPPRAWEPLVLMCRGRDGGGEYQEYANRYYSVTKRQHYLMIVNADQSARRDWREFQRIKNDLWGNETEAVELYPAESRKQDPSNAFFLWKINSRARLGIIAPRQICSPREALAPQRADHIGN